VALQKPHVILIGLDSFRYDAVVGKGPAHAPNVARFISNSASFSDATTPLARTFPSWVSILTGRNPHTTGAVINLLPRDMIETGGTLGDLFRTAGYHTVYAIDEVRFSNVDSTYGFDQTITPPIGASDFLIGWFGDTPLSNLMVNTRLGALLFPHLYANRAASKVYDPDQFIARLSRELRFDRPTFFAVHFTLPHWPFSWANSPTTGKPDKDYPIVVARVDQQFGDLMAMLERRGALTNALVIVLSDHGESFALDGDTLLHDSSLGALFEKHKSPRGHGTDVLSPEQYRVVLGMRAFGTCPIRLPVGQTIDAPVSLEDIAPTLADLFALPTSARFDGRSLRGLLEQAPGAGEAFRDRVRFTESEFNPVGFASGTFSASAAAAAALFYTVHPVTDRIEVRRNRLDEILEQREYAAFRSEELLAALPHELGTGFNLVAAARDGTRSQLLTTTPGPNAYPELESLWVALEERFKLAQRRASPNGIKN
jgi:arylsulfatase A-like enzyme